MSDPYRPAYYPSPATAGSPYYPPDYADSHDQYGPLTTRHRPDHSRNSSGYHSQSQSQLTHSNRRDDDSYDSDDHHDRERSHRRHKSKSKSRRHSPDSDYEHDRGTHSSSRRARSQSHSRIKEAGATAVGGAAGALVGHKIGHGNIGTLAGLAVGALGARALEQQYEKRQERNRMAEDMREQPFESGGGRSSRRDSAGRPGTRERRKSFVEQAQEKVSGFLGVGGGGDHGKDQKRSRSHVGATTTSSSRGGRDKYADSDSEDDDYYNDKYNDRRSSRGGGGGGDRYGSSSGGRRRDDY